MEHLLQDEDETPAQEWLLPGMIPLKLHNRTELRWHGKGRLLQLAQFSSIRTCVLTVLTQVSMVPYSSVNGLTMVTIATPQINLSGFKF